MSTYTVASLSRITAPQLHSLLLQQQPSSPSPSTSKIAIIDVRDSDYLGGHILGCQNIPLNTFDYKLPELVRTLRDKEVVVFHCMLSQQRGPRGALAYLREREREGGDGEGQKVYVLEGGFDGWQRRYGTDERVTEGYRKELWD